MNYPIFLKASLVLLLAAITPTKPAEFVVNKTTTGCKCTVQSTTERPQLGARFLGPFSTKAEAVKAMCANVDSTMSDQGKCWETHPACH